jgi:hypothetical protein
MFGTFPLILASLSKVGSIKEGRKADDNNPKSGKNASLASVDCTTESTATRGVWHGSHCGRER